MGDRLPRLTDKIDVANLKTGKASLYFQRLWDQFATRIEGTLEGVVSGIVVGDGLGSVTGRSIAAGTGISVTNGSGVAGNPTVGLTNTGVAAASYGDGTHVFAATVDAQGRVTAAGNTAISFPVASVFGRAGAVAAADADYSFAQIGNGTATNDNAAAGRVGEYHADEVLDASAVAATSGVAMDVLGLSLTAGDWEVEGNLTSSPDPTTTTSDIAGGISLVSGTLPDPAYRSQNDAAIPAGQRVSAPLPRQRISLAAPANVYLVGRMSFAVSTSGFCGWISARRVR